MKLLQKGIGWDVVMVPALHVKLDCGHTQEIPASWVMPGGRLSCGLQCSTRPCRRKTYDVVLEGWQEMEAT